VDCNEEAIYVAKGPQLRRCCLGRIGLNMCGYRGSDWLSVVVITEIHCLNGGEMKVVLGLRMLRQAPVLIIVSGCSRPTMVSFGQSQ
jgi:hypothetical protein